MKELFDDMREFYDHFGFAYPVGPAHLPRKLAEFRRQFLLEEFIEWEGGVKAGDLVAQLDGLVDICYIAIGSAVFHGFEHRAWSLMPLHVPFSTLPILQPPRVLTPEEAPKISSVLEEPIVNYYGAVVRETEEGLHYARESLHEIAFRTIAVARRQGLDFLEAWRRVHAANLMKKRGPTSRDDLYDLVKPEGWTPPDLSDLVVAR